MRRSWLDQCTSYLQRGDFGNVTITWQWYLDPHYAKKLVDPRPLLAKGNVGVAIWYAIEMEARQEYYKRRYADRFHFVDCTLQDITHPSGAQDLLSELGHPPTVPLTLPPPRNENRTVSRSVPRAKLADRRNPAIHLNYPFNRFPA